VIRSSEGCRKFNIHATRPPREGLPGNQEKGCSRRSAGSLQHLAGAPAPYRPDGRAAARTGIL